MVVALMSIAVQASELDYAAVQTVDGQVVARVQLAPDATVVLDGPLGTVHATWRAGGKGPVVVLAWVTAAGTRGQRARVADLDVGVGRSSEWSRCSTSVDGGPEQCVTLIATRK